MILVLAYLFGLVGAVAVAYALPDILGVVAAIPMFIVSTLGAAGPLLRARDILGGGAA